ncbi:SusC/RagA family TonB-linked outer membrane protein [Albibacterium profundi]|uniref:SusC/RagA family TonB-linked outer membrane protein n=1 Tax=Albibacterium profundi TaxID=3134906 RepID=A0ABV5CCQ8_9SPHI
MSKVLLFSVALGLMISADVPRAKAGTVADLSTTAIYSENRLKQNTVQGTVTDEQGPVPGVTVTVVGTNTVVVTDGEGQYRIDAPVGSTLRFSSIGYSTKEVEVSSATLNVILEMSHSSLEQVVVVGYGTQKKEHLTGAVSSVNVEEVLGSRPIPDVGRGLQGTVPGLSIVVPSGEVGSDPVMKIRGQIGSIAGSSNPLILVDNVEIPSIQMINPNDIESISVLKDAASTSIYGAKAAFGVVLITTKKGAKVDGNEVSYSTNLSFQSPFKEIDIAGIDGLEYTLEAHENMKASGAAGGFWRVSRESFEKIKEWQTLYGGVVDYDDPVVYGRDWYYDGVDKFGVRIYDPVKTMIKDHGFSQKHNISLNGKKEDTKYNFSVGYLGQEGMMKPANHDDFKRFTSNLNASTAVNDFLTLRGGARFTDGTKRYANSATGFGADPWLYLYRWSRLFPTGVTELGEEIRDPYFDTKNANDAIQQDRYLNLNLGTTVDFTSNWNLIADYSYTAEFDRFTSSMPRMDGAFHWYAPQEWYDEEGNRVYVDEAGNRVEDGGVAGYRFPVTEYVGKNDTYFYQNSFNSAKHTFNAYSTYNLSLQDNHELKFMLGTNMVAYKWNSHSSRRTDLINPENPQFPFTVGTAEVGGGANWESQVGFFGRANYAFMDKYLLEANLRYDATSKFPSHLQWKWYPSFSAGWILTNEDFMQSLNPILSFAKLRGSWGSIGDQSVSNSLYLPTMGIGQNSWLSSSGEQFFQLGTPAPVSMGITWQDIEHLNLGADLRFFNNRLGITAEWFQRDTRNMIISGEDLPAVYGASAPQGNYGNLRTKGWELAADYSHLFENGLRLTFNANISDATTVITKSADWNTPWENRLISSTFATGKRYGDIYGFVTDRLYQKEDFVYDADGNMQQVTIVYEGGAKVTNQLAGDNPVYQTYFEDGNQVMLISPGDVKFVDVNGDGYIDAGNGTFGDPGDRVVIGNSTPRYQYGFRVGADFKGFDLSVFLQGVGKRKIWGNGQLATPGYHVKDGAMPQAIAEDFWKEDRTDAFYPRAWNLGGANSGFVMRPQTRYLLDMSYLKIKNITFGYALPQNILRTIKLSRARVYVSLENMFTFDNLRGLPIDPEAISGHSLLTDNNGNYNLGRTSMSNPAFKSASFGIQIGL